MAAKEPVIEPDFIDVYCWELIPHETNIQALIKYPPNFDTSKVTYELNEQKDAVQVHYPDQPPIIEGKLFTKVNAISHQVIEKDSIYLIQFDFDKLEKLPDFLVTDFHPQTKKIDPLSAFLIYNKQQESKDQKVKEDSFNLLDVGLKYNFVPAMIAAAALFRHIPQLQERSLELTCIAADRYHAPAAELNLGLLYLNMPDSRDRALEYIEKASREPQLPIASIILALYLSPISDMESPKKDAKRAVQLFQQVITKETEPNPLALHEYAMLLYNGIGIEKDVEKAKELNEKCKQIEPNAPELEERDETYKPKPHEHCHCGCCHEHEAEEHHHCGCGHCGGHGGCGCGGHCDGHGGCGHCDGHGGCGGHCHCEHN